MYYFLSNLSQFLNKFKIYFSIIELYFKHQQYNASFHVLNLGQKYYIVGLEMLFLTKNNFFIKTIIQNISTEDILHC